ncbi:hypothetical protein EVAR_41257_1 [Eumeta japonica]|uniref:Uncharacterized protein n=1 Tax=Eumeta variegata TaxID=151549 RepID=A0A4C1W742_EUMVA|nr:hypothetical protein EVAR_41257_1 [Eumeta japonica]
MKTKSKSRFQSKAGSGLEPKIGPRSDLKPRPEPRSDLQTEPESKQTVEPESQSPLVERSVDIKDGKFMVSMRVEPLAKTSLIQFDRTFHTAIEFLRIGESKCTCTGVALGVGRREMRVLRKWVRIPQRAGHGDGRRRDTLPVKRDAVRGVCPPGGTHVGRQLPPAHGRRLHAHLLDNTFRSRQCQRMTAGEDGRQRLPTRTEPAKDPSSSILNVKVVRRFALAGGSSRVSKSDDADCSKQTLFISLVALPADPRHYIRSLDRNFDLY